MKTKLIVILVCIVGFIASCDNNDDDTQNEPTIHGAWNLTHVSGGFAGVDDNFEPGDIMWNFDNENSVLTVENNNSTQVIFDGLDSGTYQYALSNGDTLQIDGNVYGSFTITQDELIIDQGVVSDGFLLEFQR